MEKQQHRPQFNGGWTDVIGTVNKNNQSNNIRKSGEKLIQNSDSVGQRDRPHKGQPQDVVGANIGVYSPDIQPKPR